MYTITVFILIVLRYVYINSVIHKSTGFSKVFFLRWILGICLPQHVNKAEFSKQKSGYQKESKTLFLRPNGKQEIKYIKTLRLKEKSRYMNTCDGTKVHRNIHWYRKNKFYCIVIYVKRVRLTFPNELPKTQFHQYKWTSRSQRTCGYTRIFVPSQLKKHCWTSSIR